MKHGQKKEPIQAPCQRGGIIVVGPLSGKLHPVLARPARQVYSDLAACRQAENSGSLPRRVGSGFECSVQVSGRGQGPGV